MTTSKPQGIFAAFDFTAEHWMEQSACLPHNPEDWFWDAGTPLDIKRHVRKVCGECPVATQCLEYAIRTGTTEGVYGGMTPRQRNELRRGGAIVAKVRPPLSFGAHNQRDKTHCKHGHEFTELNTRRDARGWRRCLECEDVKYARRRAETAAKKAAS